MNRTDVNKACEELNLKLLDDNIICTSSNKKVCNFIPYVIEQKIIDSKIYLNISGIGINNEILPNILLDSHSIQKSNWVIDNFGFKYFIDKKCMDDFIRLIQLLCINVKTKFLYNHTGFINQNNKWGYLHGGGCIGDLDVEVELDKSIDNYVLPNKVTDLYVACEQSLKLINILDEYKGIIPLSIVYLSPIIELISKKIKPPEFVLWIWGKTGSRKTAISKVFLSHFGNFINKIPSTFNDTATAIELKANLLKDSLYLCDDYAPKQEYKEEKIQDSKAELILRMYGDRIGKGRSSNQLDIKRTNEPKGMVIVTGESIISGESSNARLLSIEVNRKSVDLDILTEAQEMDYLLREAMSGYIEWILKELNDESEFIDLLVESLKKYKLELREKYKDIAHGRIIEACGWIKLGFNLMLTYMLDKSIIYDYEDEFYNEKADKVIDDLVSAQNKLISSNSPKDQFLNTLKEAIDSKSIRIATLNEKNQVIETNLANICGYKDQKYYYFYTDKLYTFVKREHIKKGVNMGISQRALVKQLREEGIVNVDADNNSPKKVINIKDASISSGYKTIRPRMLQFDINTIDNFNI